MKKKALYLLSLLIISQNQAEDFSNKVFPGGYLNVGFQLGKTKNNDRYIDVQISPAIVLIGPYKNDLPGYLFFSNSIGRRYLNGDSFFYFDMNLNFWNILFNFGIGKGGILIEDKISLRTKYWGGLGFIPFIVSADNYHLNEIKYKQVGIMGILTIPIFGNNFYP